MSHVRHLALGAVALGLLSVGGAVQAGVLFSNLGNSDDESNGISTTSGGPLAASFSTSGAATLASLELTLYATTPSDGNTFTIALLSDSSTKPGSVLTSNTYDDSMLTTSAAD